MKKRLKVQSKWTKKKTAILAVAIFIGLGIVAGLTGYFLSRKEEVKAEKAAVYPQGGAVAYDQSDVVGLKVIGGTQTQIEPGNGYMRFVLENRLGIAKQGQSLPNWQGDLIKTLLTKRAAWVSLPLQVWGTEQNQWFDVFSTYFGSVYKTTTIPGFPGYRYDSKTIRVLRFNDGEYKIFPTDKTGGLKVYCERPGYYYQELTGGGMGLPQTIKPNSGEYHWCVRFPIAKENWNKLNQQTLEINLNPDLLKRMKELGSKLREYRTYFYFNDRNEIIDSAKAAGRAGLIAPQSLNGSVDQSGKVVLTWDAKSGMNAKGFTIRKRVQGTTGWTSESTVLDYPAATYTDSDITKGKTYDYQIRTVSYFDSNIKADGPTKTITVGDIGISEPIPPQEGDHPAPTNLITKPGDSKVGLHWNAPQSANFKLAAYLVGRTEGQFSNKKEIVKSMKPLAKVPAKQTSYLDAAVTNGTTYNYVVFAVYSDGKASDPAGPVQAIPKVGGGGDIPEDVNLDGLVNWLDVAKVLAYNGFPGVKVEEKVVVREDVNRDNIVDWLDISLSLIHI